MKAGEGYTMQRKQGGRHSGVTAPACLCCLLSCGTRSLTKQQLALVEPVFFQGSSGLEQAFLQPLES